MATIKYFIQTDANPAGIYVRLLDGRAVDAKAKTNLVVNPKDWSKVKGRPVNLKSEDLKILNKKLDEFHAKLTKRLNERSDNEIINSNWLKRFINPDAKRSAPVDLLSYFEFYKEVRGEEISKGTIKKINVVKAMLVKYEAYSRRNYLIKEVGDDFKRGFESYCKGEKYNHNSITKYLLVMRLVCYHASTKGLEIHPELSSLKLAYKEVPAVYLDQEEIKIIENKKFDQDYLDNARDWLLISCETGQRVSDFMRFDKTMIRYEKNKKKQLKPLIEFTQVKTNKIMSIPLSPRVMKLLEKRDGNFPRSISDQKYNEYIKEVCKECKINKMIEGSLLNGEIMRKEKGSFEKWQLVSSHIGRRSFASNYYGIIPTALLIGVTGHSTEKQFLAYIGKSETTKALQLSEYF